MSGSVCTLKIRFDLESGDPELFNQYLNQYNSYFRTFYNALVDNPNLKYKDLPEIVKGYYPENNLIDSYLLNSAFQDAQSVYNRFNVSRLKSGLEPLGHKIIFGGKENFARRAKGLISKEQFKENRLRPLYVIGESFKSGNGRFRIKNFKCIEYIVNRKPIFSFKLHDKRLRILNDLKLLQDNKEIPITYKVSKKYIYITFDKSKVKSEVYDLKTERHLSIDLNPEYIGLTVFDNVNGNQKLIDSKVFDLSEILKRHTDSKSSSDSKLSKYYNSKRKFELNEINKQIFNLSKHYKAQYIDIENLHFKGLKGRKCTSQWNKTLTVNYLESKCSCSNIHLLKVNPCYTSIIGNIINNYNIPDMCRSALEIGKRSLSGINLNSFNSKEIDYKSHLEHFNEVKDFIIKSIEERDNKVKIPEIKDFKDISKVIKDFKIKFRKSLDECKQFESVCNLKSFKSLIKVKTYMDYKHLNLILKKNDYSVV